MITLSSNDKEVIASIVHDTLTLHAPEEVAIYSVTSGDILGHVSASEKAPSDSDAFFGGLGPSFGEFLSHVLALIAVEFMRHGWTMTRASVMAYLQRRSPGSTVSATTTRITAAEQQILEALEKGSSADQRSADNPEPSDPDSITRT